MLLAHALTLAAARSHVAALADRAVTIEAAIDYDRVLLEIDALHGDDDDGGIPAIDPVTTTDPNVLFTIAATAIEDLTGYGIDALNVELVLDMLHLARDQDSL